MNRCIVLMRHGTALKNVDNKHGGSGSSLVSVGKVEVKKAGNSLLKLDLPFQNIYYVNRDQCTESAAILGDSMNVNAKELTSIEPFNLGVLDDLSETEAKSLYPDISHRMELWRKGEIDITQLRIPKATDPELFYSKCQNVLSKLNDHHMIIIGTRSLLVAFASILLERKPIPNGGYVEIPWKNSAFAVFFSTKEGYKLDNTLSTNVIMI